MSDFRENLKAYMDGELDKAGVAEVQEHYDNDPEVRREVDQLHAISQILRTGTVQPSPEGFERTLLALSGSKRRRAETVRGWALGLGFATALVGLLFLPNLLGWNRAEGGTSAAEMSKQSVAMASPSESAMERAAKQMGTGAVPYSPDRAGVAPLAAFAKPGATNLYAGDRQGAGGAPGIVAPGAAGASDSGTSGPVAQNEMTPFVPQPPPLRGRSLPPGSGPLPAGPLMNVQPLPGVAGTTAPALPQPMGPAVPVRPDPGSISLNPSAIAMSESAVRKVVASMGGQVVGVSALRGGQANGGKSILVSVAAERAPVLASRLRSALAMMGTVSDPFENPAGRSGRDLAVATKERTRATAPAAAPAPALRAESSEAASETDADANTLEQDLSKAKKKREELLLDFYEDAPAVKDVEAEIAELEKKLAAARKSSPPKKPAAPTRKFIQIMLQPRLSLPGR